jgi:hypothetical protein
MAFLFGGSRKQKSPAEIAKSLKELLYKLWEPTVNPKVEEDVAKHMAQMKLIVQGTPGWCYPSTGKHRLILKQKLIAARKLYINSSRLSYRKTYYTNSLGAYDYCPSKRGKTPRSSSRISSDSSLRMLPPVTRQPYHIS